MTTVRRLRRLCLVACLAVTPAAAVAQDKPASEKLGTVAPAATAALTHSLQECVAIALERQPNIKAAFAQMRASEIGNRSLNNLGPVARLFTPDLPFRKQQSVRGLTTSQADVLKTQYETIYDVTRLYYTFVYAKQQEGTATEIIDQMQVYYGIADTLLKDPNVQPPPGLNQFTLFRMEDAIAEVKKPRITASKGQELALAALKEAMGVEQSYAFTPRDEVMPIMDGDITKEQVVGYAMTRRPELTLASAGVDAFRLEVCAQNAVRRSQKVPTLASGTDLHSRYVPGPVRNGEYRPGAIAPDMPPQLVGKRADRVDRAKELSNRQETVLEKTQNLVELEATNSFLLWQGTVERYKLAKGRYDTAQRMLKLSREGAANFKQYDQLVLNEALAAKAQAEYLESIFENIKALAALERITTGGVKPNFPQK